MNMDLTGLIPESWCCIDCGRNTAPGCANKAEMEKTFAADANASVTQHFDNDTEVYTVRDVVWKKAGMAPYGGCLCIGCLEKRLGRKLEPKDFRRSHPFGRLPGSERLLERRWQPPQ